jgi:hypothetical protein
VPCFRFSIAITIQTAEQQEWAITIGYTTAWTVPDTKRLELLKQKNYIAISIKEQFSTLDEEHVMM